MMLCKENTPDDYTIYLNYRHRVEARWGPYGDVIYVKSGNKDNKGNNKRFFN